MKVEIFLGEGQTGKLRHLFFFLSIVREGKSISLDRIMNALGTGGVKIFVYFWFLHYLLFSVGVKYAMFNKRMSKIQSVTAEFDQTGNMMISQ